jgi:hypothetical protein
MGQFSAQRAAQLSRRTFLGGAAGVSALAGWPPAADAQVQAHAFAADTAAKDLRQSQLFLDDTWIEETYRLERAWETAEIFPEPVLRPETRIDGYQMVISGSVFRIGNDWRLYYMTYNRPDPMRLCMAVSSDGMRWERPKLGRVAVDGNKDNNIVWHPPGDQSFTACTVCHDPADARAPFKMMYYGAGGGKPTGTYVALSADGIDWRLNPEPVLTTTGDQTNLMGTRDRRGKFVAFLRHKMMLEWHRARTVWRTESDDFLHWSEPQCVLRPDLQDDPNVELYGFTGFRYSDMYLGLIDRWRGNPDLIETHLAWSHDGIAWMRPPDRAKPFIAPQFSWNERWNSSVNTAPIRVGNVLRFYFGGRNRAHGRELGQTYGAVGMAVIPVDRFAAIRADFKEGQLITRPMTWPGGDLLLTCTHTRYQQGFYNGGGGNIEVEVRDEGNAPIPQFAGDRRARFNNLSPMPWAEQQKPVRWADDRSAKELAGKRIRLVFLLRDARLFSFRAGA